MQPHEPEKESLPADDAASTPTTETTSANDGHDPAAADAAPLGATPEHDPTDPELSAARAESGAISGSMSEARGASREAPDVSVASITDFHSSAGPRVWAPALVSDQADSTAETASAATGSRFGRFALVAGSLALAACLGAAGGVAGVAGVSRWMAPPPPPPAAAVPRPRPDGEIKALRDAVTQLRGQVRSLSEHVSTLKASSEASGKSAQSQFAKLAETIDRLEKSQAEPLARLSKMAAAIERLEKREASVASSDITGSVRQGQSGSQAPTASPDTRANRPVLPGWRLHEVQRGVALVEGRIGLAEVMVGDTLRGVGRVQDIRREDGRWIVVTSRGVILPAR